MKLSKKGTSGAGAKTSALEIVLYIVAGITAAIAIYMTYSAISYISSYYSNYGVSINSNPGQAIQYIVGQAFAYYAWMFVFFVLARVIRKLGHPTVIGKSTTSKVAVQTARLSEESPEERKARKEKEEAEKKAREDKIAAEAENKAQKRAAKEEARAKKKAEKAAKYNHKEEANEEAPEKDNTSDENTDTDK